MQRESTFRARPRRRTAGARVTSAPRPPAGSPAGTGDDAPAAADSHWSNPTGGGQGSRPDRRGLLTRLGVITCAAGVGLALLLLPAIGAIGLFAKSSADHYLSLPAELITPPLPESSRILAADGSLIATLRGEENRTVVDGKAIPAVMRQAIVSIEDARFYSHGGVDVKGVVRAVLRNSEAGDVQQGASTLTQQYVKNVLLQNARTRQQREEAAGTSLERKIQEARYAVALENKITKDEILERYLNIAYFGNGNYGVGTAAQNYFHVGVADLTLPQAALLAGLVQSPSLYDPVNHPDAARARRDVVLDRIAALGHITPAAADAAKTTPVTVVRAEAAAAQDSCETSSASFFCDFVRSQLLADPALGTTEAERARRLHEGGLVIRTTLQPKVQAAAQNTVNAVIAPSNPVSATEVVIEPGTGNILAMAVNRVFGSDSAANQTKEPLATKAVFQPGSTFKTFTLAAALEAGYGLNTQFYSPSCYSTKAFPLNRRDGSDCATGYSNADPAESGVYDMSRATWDSVNTYYIQLEEKIGVRAVVNMATRLGIPASYLADVHPTKGDLTIGSERVTPLDMANAYATLAAHGVHCDPRYVLSATDSGNQNVDIAPTPACQRAVSAGVADTVTSILAGVITQGTGYPNAAAIGRPAAGKTGTTDNYSSAWFVGYTPQMAASVAVGNPRGAQGNPLKGVVADGRTWSRVFGGDLPAIIWGRSLRAALADVPAMPMSKADPTVARGTKGGLLSTPPPPPPAPTAAASGGPIVPTSPLGAVGPVVPNAVFPFPPPAR
ncbi:transglycosylase domain-containing protein [Protofrankia symbiont of Coriaria ruscifolia]|uniref:Peptidoglycan glycosyltransferase n=1 Tax=Candidatus Protofrankia californiensis TaxID=1839754 RepID=A0A1C3NW45_9ACTN|nr:transglycosylase domain-containing protein [Protofrankia symbiont of Coriaria ruscifolia]SBW20286.1 peptidoglycan glycosyltransferase [Candidatus Protofrankia californiensis]